MKTIILVSSIFYLLGLKVSNNVELVKKAGITPAVSNKLELPEKPGVNVRFHEGSKLEAPKIVDSLKVIEASKIPVPEEKKKI
jgi:hypothetical protein